jgi:hypothetical protein
MTTQEARAYFHYLMTLCIRNEEAFAPLALKFVREHDLDQLGLLPEEQVNVFMAMAEAYGDEPKRYSQKLECLQKAEAILSKGRYADPGLANALRHAIRKIEADREIYNEACRAQRAHSGEKQRIIIETDLPDYFLTIAQKRAAGYYRQKFKLSDEAQRAQEFTQPSAHRKFEPQNTTVHKGFPGSCPPFKNARASAFHVMLPFDLKVSRKPDDPLAAGVRIWYMKHGYSFPLRAEWGKLCSWYDNEVLDISLDDPYLVYISVSELKETELGRVERDVPPDAAPEMGLPLAFLYATAAVGTFIQIPCNIKVWFDASQVALLLQGAPDLPDYGLHGASGLITRTYSMEKVGAYVESFSKPWQEGLSFNFINIHAQLLPGVETAYVPYNTPIFSVFPVLSRQSYEIVDRREVEEASASGASSR